MEGFDISKINLKNSKEPSVEEKLTGSVISNLKDKEVEPNVELEGKEYLRFPDGEITRAEGEDHGDKSGIKMYLPDGTTILSNSMKVNSSDAKRLSKDFDVKIKAGVTYAEAQEAYRKKIGLAKLDKEQEEAIVSLRKTMEKETDENTKRVNEEFLKNKIGEIEQTKAGLQPEYDQFFQSVFELQESKTKPKDDTKEYKYGGLTKNNLNKVLEKYGLTEEELLGAMTDEGIDKFPNGGTTSGYVNGVHVTDKNRNEMREMGEYLTPLTGTVYDVTDDTSLSTLNSDLLRFYDDAGISYKTDSSGRGEVPGLYKSYQDYTGRVKSMEEYYGKMGQYDGGSTGYLTPELQQAHSRMLDTNNYVLDGEGNFEDLYVKPYLTMRAGSAGSKTSEFTRARLAPRGTTRGGNLASYSGDAWVRRNGGTIGNFANGGEVEKLRKQIEEGTISGPTAQREMNKLKAMGQDVSDIEPQVEYLLESTPSLRTKADRIEGVYKVGYQRANEGGYGTVTQDNLDEVIYSLYKNFPDYATDRLKVKFDKEGKIQYDKRAYNREADNIKALQQDINTRGGANLSYMESRPDLFTDSQIESAREYTKNELFDESKGKETDSLLGGYTGTRFNLGLSIVKPDELEKLEEDRVFTARQLQQKLKEDPEYVSEESQKALATYISEAPEGVDFRLDALTAPVVQELDDVDIIGEKKEEVRGETLEDDIVAQTRKRFPRAFAHMDMRPLPPSPMEAHLKGDTRLERIDPIRVGTQNVEQQIANQMGAAMTQIESLPPSQRASAMASLQATAGQSLNQGIMQANQINAQNQSSAELFNIGQSAQEQQANLANALSYEKRQMMAKSNTEEDTRRYYDRLQSIALNEMQNNQRLNMLDQMSDNYSLNLDGTGVTYDPTSQWAPNDTQKLMRLAMQLQQENTELKGKK